MLKPATFLTLFIGLGGIITLLFLFSGTENDTPTTELRSETAVEGVPSYLVAQFPTTDWTKFDPALDSALSGGPGKDGIPAIDTPVFVPLSEFSRPDSVQAIVLTSGNKVKVYPYNILTWHEIVNDTVGNIPVAVTFCPLCGSAIVFDRTLPDGTVSTFGVSGSLLESNMIMYDRASENLWQQSTGRTLAGSFHEAELSLAPFQLLTLGEVRELYPSAQVLSETTGFRRDYGRNPYAGYETDNRFIFEPSTIDSTFAPKEIMVVFRTDAQSVATVPWNQLREAGSATLEQENETYTLNVSNGSELEITNGQNEIVPFYYEMWFSVAAQHRDSVTVLELN